MEALDASIRHLLSLEAPLNAWAAHSAQAEAALISAAGESVHPSSAGSSLTADILPPDHIPSERHAQPLCCSSAQPSAVT